MRQFQAYSEPTKMHALVDCGDFDVLVKKGISEDDTADTTCNANICQHRLHPQRVMYSPNLQEYHRAKERTR